LEGTRTYAASVETLILAKDEVILKAINDGNLVGCVHLQQSGALIYLGLLSVEPTGQAKGIGKQLLKAAEEYADKLQCTSIVITVISARQELIEWYQRRGFTPTGEIKPFRAGDKFGIQKQPLQLLEMVKTL
jgi:N-acetylglutamate synthase-like GNAT family acetyltransferase